MKGLIREICGNRCRYTFEVLNDPYGSTITDPLLDALVVSVETLPRALEINELRVKRGFKPLHIIVIPIIRDGYGVKVSSTLIRLITEREVRG